MSTHEHGDAEESYLGLDQGPAVAILKTSERVTQLNLNKLSHTAETEVSEYGKY